MQAVSEHFCASFLSMFNIKTFVSKLGISHKTNYMKFLFQSTNIGSRSFNTPGNITLCLVNVSVQSV